MNPEATVAVAFLALKLLLPFPPPSTSLSLPLLQARQSETVHVDLADLKRAHQPARARCRPFSFIAASPISLISTSHPSTLHSVHLLPSPPIFLSPPFWTLVSSSSIILSCPFFFHSLVYLYPFRFFSPSPHSWQPSYARFRPVLLPALLLLFRGRTGGFVLAIRRRLLCAWALVQILFFFLPALSSVLPLCPSLPLLPCRLPYILRSPPLSSPWLVIFPPHLPSLFIVFLPRPSPHALFLSGGDTRCARASLPRVVGVLGVVAMTLFSRVLPHSSCMQPSVSGAGGYSSQYPRCGV
ncbi:hypothetical protein K438DRAFT_1989637 [Mycena galopus ATCC 62051]|nr:hypothetical protein K438DRAFT_1989637 [Mycena galopus ATCC 62051]